MYLYYHLLSEKYIKLKCHILGENGRNGRNGRKRMEGMIFKILPFLNRGMIGGVKG
jgi:hypothetical protein